MENFSKKINFNHLREFTMAEIEHFCDPNDKSHSKFCDVENTIMKLYSACNQMDGQPPVDITIGEAVSKVTIIVYIIQIKF